MSNSEGGGLLNKLKNTISGNSNPSASSTHQDGVEHIQNKLDARNQGDHQERQDPNTIATPGTSGSTNPLNTTGSSTQQGGLTGSGSVSDSYRDAPTGSQTAHKGEVQQELKGLVEKPAPATSEGVGIGSGLSGNSGSGTVAPQSATGTHGVGSGSSYPAVGTEQSATGSQTGAYSDSGVRGGGVGTTNQTGSALNQGVEFTGHRSAQEVAGIVAGTNAESTRGVPPPEAGWHPSGRAAADGSERGAERSGHGSNLGGGAAGVGAGAAAATVLSDRTRNDPAYDQSGLSGHPRGSDVGLGAPGTARDPAHDASGTTFAPQSATRTHDVSSGSHPHVGSTQRDTTERQSHVSDNSASALGAGAGGAGLAAGALGAESTRDRDGSSTTRKEHTDPTDTATEKLRRDPTHSASDDAVLGSDAAGPHSGRGERGIGSDDAGTTTTKERTDPTDSSTSKLERDPAQSAKDDHVLGSDAKGQSSGRGEEVDPERKEEVKHQTPENPKDDPYWQGKESAREHLEHEAREGRTVKSNPDSIPTAGGEKLGSKHWGESKMIPE